MITASVTSNLPDEHIEYEALEVQDRIMVFLAGLQGEQGYSNFEVATGALQAVFNFIAVLEGDQKQAVLNHMKADMSLARREQPRDCLHHMFESAALGISMREDYLRERSSK